MINLTALVGRITGKGAPGADARSSAGSDEGVATGSDFAALVALAARGRSGPRLVVDNGAAVGGLPDAALQATLANGRAVWLGMTEDGTLAMGKPATPAAATAQGEVDPALAALLAQFAPEAGEGEGDALPVVGTGGEGAEDKEGKEGKEGAAPSIDAGPLLQTAVALPLPVGAQLPPPPPSAASGGEASAPPNGVTALMVTLAAAVQGDQAGATPEAPVEGDAPAPAGLAAVGDAALAGSPLRAIVDSLPPVLQSSLSPQALRMTTGPSTGAMLGEQVIDMGVSGQWIDRMAREIAGLAEGTGHSRFTLNPPHLGRLQVDLWRDQNATTSVRMLTETSEAMQRLNEGRPALQADARIAALQFGSITIEKASAPFESNNNNQGQASRQGGDLAGQAQQQNNGGQAQGRAPGQQGDWVSRSFRDEAGQASDARPDAVRRAADSNVRFA